MVSTSNVRVRILNTTAFVPLNKCSNLYLYSTDSTTLGGPDTKARMLPATYSITFIENKRIVETHTCNYNRLSGVERNSCMEMQHSVSQNINVMEEDLVHQRCVVIIIANSRRKVGQGTTFIHTFHNVASNGTDWKILHQLWNFFVCQSLAESKKYWQATTGRSLLL